MYVRNQINKPQMSFRYFDHRSCCHDMPDFLSANEDPANMMMLNNCVTNHKDMDFFVSKVAFQDQNRVSSAEVDHSIVSSILGYSFVLTVNTFCRSH